MRGNCVDRTVSSCCALLRAVVHRPIEETNVENVHRHFFVGQRGGGSALLDVITSLAGGMRIHNTQYLIAALSNSVPVHLC